MKSVFAVGSFVALAPSVGLVVVLGAQGAAPPPSKGSAAPDTYDPNKTHIVTGCLKPAEKDGDFVLADGVDTKSTSVTG